MKDFVKIFEERLQEIESYLDLLDQVDKQVQEGLPRIGKEGNPVSVQQQQILYSSVYLQLYNLIEATVSLCIEGLREAILAMNLQPKDLTAELRREWVRSTARTHIDLGSEKRLASALHLCDHLVQALPISEFIVKSGGGNWDDSAIERIAGRLGLLLRVDEEVKRNIKQRFKNDQGALAFIKNLRNDLAHGKVSFAECGRGVTVRDLRRLKELTASYLREVISCFQATISGYEFLVPERRPQGAAT